MEIKIQSIHFDASEQLQAFIDKKAGKLSKYCEEIRKLEVSLKVVKPETALNKDVLIKVFVPNSDMYAEKICNTFEEAVDECVSALEKQLLKYKEKQSKK